MARDTLHAWVCGIHIGRFERDIDTEKPWFLYDANAVSPLSLSLPMDRPHARDAAKNFLEALLPENPAARASIQAITGAASAEYWELLCAIGGDLQGGVVLHLDEDGPERSEPFVFRAFEEEVADRIRQIRRGGTGFADRRVPVRFSLAGAQSKFALARHSEGDFWSDSATPSTHILKPESREHPGLELIEAATLDLANRAGVRAPRAEQVSFSGETAFSIERFDRRRGADGEIDRIHVEDMTQALGTSVGEKYGVMPDDIVLLLRAATGNDELGYAFYRQFAFNALIGNSDAHGKNYSIVHREDGRIDLSPLYDAIPIGMYPQYDQALAMPVSWNEQFVTVTSSDWIESAAQADLDPDRVLGIVQEVAEGILEHLDDTIGAVDHPVVTAERLDVIRRVNDRSC